MDISATLLLGAQNAFYQVGKMALFLIPIIIFLEILRDLHIVQKASRLFAPLMRLFRLPGEAAVPIVVGLVFGILYGAGVLIQAGKDGSLNAKEMTVIGLFLSLNHAFIEDPLLFTMIGADYLLLQALRLVASVVITALFALRLLPPLSVPVRKAAQSNS
ncbi:conserved hypothetical protein [Heliomicrobium modesticaldum Ice1]|uniref:Nucleoside transporter/FeoB GTPase Gate domain-containing protein n=1 Tax=Heliobacterium modesticaldum (strain ATCC 51547 / Ice1) TaxID=498761 RepID=B0TDM4_HELMI|nr:nucleoside recognition domain-containing protein [Heliomicrobium modesticaldum]ABZ85549.1 conserved hypothetical protein [Heliomicrobium modesticaldum Ice1]